MPRKTLFLDFDGVFHAVDAAGILFQGRDMDILGEVFVFQPILADLIQEHDIDIVIHSSWRNYFDLEEIKERWLLPAIRSRVVGITQKGVDRAESIAEYLDDRGIEDFLILDDTVDSFVSFVYCEGRDLRPNLALCNGYFGISDVSIQRKIKAWLEGKAA